MFKPSGALTITYNNSDRYPGYCLAKLNSFERLLNKDTYSRSYPVAKFLKVYQNMHNNKSVSCPGLTIKPKLFLLYISTFITLLTFFCDGQAITTVMFEIPSKDQKLYTLKDCRKMAGNDIDCKCAYLGRECQQADVENCKKCSCLNGSARIFYVKKRYGAVCLGRNNVYNAGKSMN